ncbi:molybdopterin biosynthesis enzyme [Solirubrobacter pauli]|uniref:Molybdopterin molybdenumtransferase n=1 Tax=Solirubrobacter pauli TaxID=166793 RepID=A0A660L4I1_9ACTN|nr:hypothetical protein [Solirubrobacter pauli]RKQ86823.1 molybdopterin biosynthesis enzyme [Solirubrobacter pauli]
MPTRTPRPFRPPAEAGAAPDDRGRHAHRDRAGDAPTGADGASEASVAPDLAAAMWLAAWGGGRTQRERVPLVAALGRVTADPVWAQRSSPAQAVAAADGIAVCSLETAGAAANQRVRLVPRQFELVSAGDPLPPGRDAVIALELVECGGAGRGAWITAPAGHGQHVRAGADDVAAGELLLVAGHRLRALDLALAAAAGVTELTVRRRPAVAVIPVGDVAATASLLLDGQAREAGCLVEHGPTVSLERALLDAACTTDLVIVVAGPGTMRPPGLPEVLRRCGEVVVRGVDVASGRPALLGLVRNTPVLVCPACPVAAASAFAALAEPVLAALSGASPARREETAQLAATCGSRGRLPVRLATVEGRRVAVPVRRGAQALSGLVRADGWLADADGDHELPAGLPVVVERLHADAPATVLVAGAPDPALDRLLLAHRGLGFCELTPTQAVALVRAGGCHAAAFSGVLGEPAEELEVVPLADVDLVIAGGPALRADARVAVGPQGTPAHRAVAAVVAPRDVVAVRSDAAAFAALAAGHAELAVGAAAAVPPGMPTTDLGRAPLNLIVRRGAAERDPALRALLDTVARLREQR